MARRKKQDDGERNLENHNVKAREGIRNDAFKRMYNLDREIAEAIAEYVAPLRASRAEVWKGLREGLNQKAEDIRPFYALYKRSRDVEMLDDLVDRANSQDALREQWEVTAKDETLDFVAAMQKGEKDGDGDVRPRFLKDRSAAEEPAGSA